MSWNYSDKINSLNKLIAAKADCEMFLSLLLPKLNNLETTVLSLLTETQTEPTGFSGVPPVGPAIPDIAIA